MKVFNRFISILATGLTWTVTICALLITMVLYGPRLFGFQPYVVLSGSMEPVIQTGSLAYIRDLDGPIDEGDVIAFEKDDICVVHRVSEVLDDGYRTKGDANSTRDMGRIYDEQVIGEYAFAVPIAGYLLSWVSSYVLHIGPVKLPSIVIIAAGVLLLLYAVQALTGYLADNED